VLEMDDVHKKGKVHAGTVVVPAALVLGGHLSSDGRSIILATVLGYEIDIRVALALARRRTG